MSTQELPQRVGVIVVQPLVQARAIPPSLGFTAQTGVEPEHVVPQRPQFVFVARSVSQPFVAS